ncbi:unnamed protein product [Didymodactylos carnosus]|uniref:Uncharacterized protein n=1 Tax=Didymodactylos carnosus TaxID=1234261 RepID=A0A815PFZ7_9BILA|nr:unnamed protein product [Didymodactylos carnosus]CAF1448481.1 unnamed protein product [Didymodactylos carnosus]CAF4096335.1 unnamed protein product [Didymodactylos carnosus]CAF4322579.1 unnamed protein product [Didymodactylos carnosus]
MIVCREYFTGPQWSYPVNNLINSGIPRVDVAPLLPNYGRPDVKTFSTVPFLPNTSTGSRIPIGGAAAPTKDRPDKKKFAIVPFIFNKRTGSRFPIGGVGPPGKDPPNVKMFSSFRLYNSRELPPKVDLRGYMTAIEYQDHLNCW